LIDEQLFIQNLAQTLASSVRLMLLFSSVLMVNAWLLGRRFAAPIRKLADEVNAITDIERASVRITGHRHDAIGKLTESYNNLFGRIRQLVKDIKESERQKQQYAFQMLQHQIAPHFLYNTLLCIGHLSRQGKHDQVDRTLRSLASLLGYCMGTPNELVSLDMELQMVEKYMLIQNTRFGGAFDVTIDADEAARGCAMPKLVLQPLVENAIKHGLAPKRALYGAHAGCSLRITAFAEADALRIAVSDNGMGMSAEQLEDLRRKMADPSPAAEGEHIGLVNVCRRIRIYFGESASFAIESRTGEGTALTIVLPMERQVGDPARDDAAGG
ncbi:MAG TPA: sensor histidine kinase, partial [Clostridia bacterium]|nr:sensor histidine kinase [Clostridia bacterium]